MYSLSKPHIHILTFSILERCSAYLSCALNCMNLIFEDCDSSVMLLMVGKNLKDLNKKKVQNKSFTYLNIVCTATIVLQSASVSSSAEFDNSLFTTTTFSASVIPARSKSSKLQQTNYYHFCNASRSLFTSRLILASSKPEENTRWSRETRRPAAVQAAV